MSHDRISRRSFVKTATAGTVGLAAGHKIGGASSASAAGLSTIYHVHNVPVPDPTDLYHQGVDALLHTLANAGHKLYKSATDTGPLSDPNGMIAKNDVVLVKVNAQWKYRGATNADVVKGVIQRVLDHPDGFSGEVVVFENGQGRGDLNCDMSAGGYGDTTQHANAEDESHSFSWLVNTHFAGQPVTEYLLDPARSTFFDASDHTSQGYRRLGNVSYPCFTTTGGNRIELKEGLWTGSTHDPDRLKLINIPVFKNHSGCAITGALKHFYGVLSMEDGASGRHYSQIGNQCADMWCNVQTPVLTIVDCIWVTFGHHRGYPPSITQRTDTLLAGFDPVALDYWASKHILYPAGGNSYHDPDQSTDLIAFLTQAMNRINTTYGGIGGQPVTMTESEMSVVASNAAEFGAGPPIVQGAPSSTVTGAVALGTAVLAGGALAASRFKKTGRDGTVESA